MEIKSRENELTAVVKRDLFDLPPSDVTNEKDLERWSEFRKRYHLAQSKLVKYDFPLQIDFELNSTCNLACDFCTHGHFKPAKSFLPFEVFKAVIDEGREFGLCSIKLNYINEPLLNKDLCKYIDYAKENGVLNVYFASNGILLSEETAQHLVDSRLSKIMVSIDAATPDTYLKMRGSTKYNDIVANIKRLAEIRKMRNVGYPLIRVNFLKMKTNLHEADLFLDTWSGIADMIGFQDYVGLPGVENSENVIVKNVSDFRCSFPFKLMVIDYSGKILPCCTFSGREMPMGKVNPNRKDNIQNAWHSNESIRLKTLQYEGRWEENEICRHCIKGN